MGMVLGARVNRGRALLPRIRVHIGRVLHPRVRVPMGRVLRIKVTDRVTIFPKG